MSALNETLDLVKAAQKDPLQGDLITKAATGSYTQALGLVYYNLEAPAKKLYPVITPLRNRVPRAGGGSGTAVNWKAILGINVNSLVGGVSEGNRGGVIATKTDDYTAAYKGLGFEDYVTFEADYAGKNFDDVKARAVEGLLRSLMIYEERVILGGNSSTGGIALGTPATPTCAAAAGGSITAGSYNIYVVALTLEAYLASTLSSIPGQSTRTNADASTDTVNGGTSIASAAGTATTASANLSITAYTDPVPGAYAYAWFIGTGAPYKCVQISTTANTKLTALNATGQTLGTSYNADYSKNGLVFNGLLSQVYGGSATLTSVQAVGSSATIYTSASGSLICQMANGTAGTPTVLTADNKGGVVEIDAMLKAFWDVYRLSPDTMYVNSQEAQNLTTKILSGTSNTSTLSFKIDASQSGLVGGVVVDSYLNKFALGGAKKVKIEIHPNMPAGTILFYTGETPYPLSNVANPVEIDARREYYQLEWPLRSRKYEYGVYVDEVLKNYFPPAFGIITNIGNG